MTLRDLLRMLDATYDGNDKQDLDLEVVLSFTDMIEQYEHTIKTNGVMFDYANNRVFIELE